ncbi:MAG: glycosyltransferase [Paludibacteraceae bacterium]
MKVLVAPLNWGLGHAARCVPLVNRFLAQGDEVVLGGDGESLVLLQKHFPTLPVVRLADLSLSYSSGGSQVGAMLRALPKIVRAALADHRLLGELLDREPFDLVVSDNRFGLFSRRTRCVYVTHQLHIRLPRMYRWLEPLATRLHGWVGRHYAEVWVPDYEDVERSLSGELGHSKKQCYGAVRYIGPLSRFEGKEIPMKPSRIGRFEVVAVLSGLEPQRSILEEEIVSRYTGREERVLIVEGKPSKSMLQVSKENITIVPYMDDAQLMAVLQQAQRIIARSGYSTIMDFVSIGVLEKAELIPTPGQPEQEYLAQKVEKLP